MLYCSYGTSDDEVSQLYTISSLATYGVKRRLTWEGRTPSSTLRLTIGLNVNAEYVHLVRLECNRQRCPCLPIVVAD